MDQTDTRGILHRLVESRLAKWVSLLTAVLAFFSFPFVFDPVQEAVFPKRTDVALELLSEIPIFDINRPLEGLKVDFQGRDLTALQQGVIVSQLQIRNIGDVSITPQKTTTLDPLGFQIDGGTLVKVTRVSASSQHLRSYAAPSRNGNEITLNQGLILEPGDYVRFDLLVTKPLKSDVRYRPLGKVDGVRSIGFQTPSTQGDQPSFLTKAFRGDATVQVARLVGYAFAGLGMIILFALAADQVGDLRSARNERRRKRLAEQTLSALPAQTAVISKLLANIYSARGLTGLRALERRLQRVSAEGEEEERFEGGLLPPELDAYEVMLMHRVRERQPEQVAMNELELLGFVDRKAKKVDPLVHTALEAFRDALKEMAVTRRINLSSLEPRAFIRDHYVLMDDRNEPAH